MAKKGKPYHEKLGDALKAAHAAAAGGQVFKIAELTRAHAELLRKTDWVSEMYGGWFSLIRPEAKRSGATVPVYSNYWEFVAKYMNQRLGADYALSAAASLALHADSYSIPAQLSIHTTRNLRDRLDLPLNLSILLFEDRRLDTTGIVKTASGLQLLSLEHALAAMPAAAFRLPAPELKAAVSTVRDIQELAKVLISSPAGAPAAGRIVEALRASGRAADAETIERVFTMAGLKVGAGAGINEEIYQALSARPTSGIAVRLSSLWDSLAAQLRAIKTPAANTDAFRSTEFAALREKIKEVYVNDAYNSLSIEGYQVTPELVQRVASGQFNEKQHEQDKKAKDALAARGYYEAFNAVLDSIEKIHRGAEAATVLERDCLEWRGHLFAPAARAGLLPQDALAGYRNKPVFIEGSMHVPPAREKLMDAMETLFSCLRREGNPWIKAILAHYMFVHIHPFPDGNGRVARFLMNALLVSAGFDWTVVRLSERPRYFTALEKTHMEGVVTDFSTLVVGEMAAGGGASAEMAKAPGEASAGSAEKTPGGDTPSPGK